MHPLRALVQVSERAISTGTAVLGEGRQMLDERMQSATYGGEQQQRQSPSRPAGGVGGKQHVSAAGLVRRKNDSDGLQLASMGPGLAVSKTE